jgi:hypothetical protein
MMPCSHSRQVPLAGEGDFRGTIVTLWNWCPDCGALNVGLAGIFPPFRWVTPMTTNPETPSGLRESN